MYFENINFYQKKPIVIFLMGPTGCGKTQLAILLRKFLPIELISVDSALIYRGMNIGTDKPNSLDLCNHPHRLLDIKDPIENYSAVEFRNDALREINNIVILGKIPCLVGGTMFYYNVLINGLPILPSSNIKVRNFLLTKYKKKHCLYEKLKLIDPISASRIHKNDLQRLLRALEVFYISGKSLTELTNKNNCNLPYTILQFAIMPPNTEWLNNKIKLRIKKMFILGFQKEVEILFFREDLHANLPSMRCIGYRQMWEYLQYKINYEEMFNQIMFATRKLAKNQLTWLRKWKDIYQIFCDTDSNIIIQKILDVLKKEINNL